MMLPEFPLRFHHFLLCFLFPVPRLILAGQFPAQLLHENELPAPPEVAPPDDEDNLINDVFEASVDYEDSSIGFLTNEAPINEMLDDPYAEIMDYKENPFLIPKSVLALAYYGSAPPEDEKETTSNYIYDVDYTESTIASSLAFDQEPGMPAANGDQNTSYGEQELVETAFTPYADVTLGIQMIDDVYLDFDGTSDTTGAEIKSIQSRANSTNTIPYQAIDSDPASATTTGVSFSETTFTPLEDRPFHIPQIPNATNATNASHSSLDPKIASSEELAGSSGITDEAITHDISEWAVTTPQETIRLDIADMLSGEWYANIDNMAAAIHHDYTSGVKIAESLSDSASTATLEPESIDMAHSDDLSERPGTSFWEGVSVGNTTFEGSFGGEEAPAVSGEDEWVFFDDVTTPNPQYNRFRLAINQKTSIFTTTAEHKLSTKSPTDHLSHDYQSDSWLGMVSLDEDEDSMPGGRSFFEEANDKSVSQSDFLPRNNDFNRCLVPPYPCPQGAGCQWIGRRVVCSPAYSLPELQPCNQNPCKNGGLCHDEGGSFRCECPAGFSGYVCGISRPCRPNPCHGSCKCIESCRHELGYFCQSSGGYTGKNCTIPLPKLSCEPSRMSVDLAPQLLEEFDRQAGNVIIYVSPHAQSSVVRSPQCRAHQVGTDLRVVIDLPFDECGTKSYQPRDGSGGQVFQNRIWLSRYGVGFDMPVPILDFECEYQRQYRLVTSLKPLVNSPQILSESGRFSADVQLCKVAACPGECPQQYVVNGGAIYTVGEKIHLSISSSVQLSQFVMSVESLALSCDQKVESASALSLISHGCEQSPGIFVKTRIGSKACVTFQTPRVFPCDTIYLHINVNRCQPHQTRVCPSGQQTCTVQIGKRKRRSAALGGQSFTVVGPVLLLNGSQGEGKLELFPQATNHTSTATEDTQGRTEVEKEPDGPYKDEIIDIGPAAYQLIALAIFIVSMFILLVIAVKFSLQTSTRMHSLENSI